MTQLVRDAMVREPLSLEADRSAREAGEALQNPDVRAVLVTKEGELVGVITRKTLVREVVARGLDPNATPVGAFAEPPNATLDSQMPLDDEGILVDGEARQGLRDALDVLVAEASPVSAAA